jgi:hypothetical protein
MMPSADRNRDSLVPLRGVPQIPDRANEEWRTFGDLTPDTREAVDRAIAEGTLEIRRRHEARMAGMNVVDYFPAHREDDAC